jgi:hypothetical protein
MQQRLKSAARCARARIIATEFLDGDRHRIPNLRNPQSREKHDPPVPDHGHLHARNAKLTHLFLKIISKTIVTISSLQARLSGKKHDQCTGNQRNPLPFRHHVESCQRYE